MAKLVFDAKYDISDKTAGKNLDVYFKSLSGPP